MTRVRAYKAPIISLCIAAGLVAALLFLALAPQGDSRAASGRRTVRNFDEKSQLTASSSITIAFTPKSGSCSSQKCGKFRGKVSSSDSSCVGGRTVQIKNSSGAVVTTVTTDALGNYETNQLTGLSGSYTATVLASSGYGYTCDAATSGSVTV